MREIWEGDMGRGETVCEEDEERFKKEMKQFSMRGNNRHSHLPTDGNHMLMAAIQKLISYNKHIKEKISPRKHVKS